MRPILGLLLTLLAVAPTTAEPPKSPTREQLLIAERLFNACGVYLASEPGPLPYFYFSTAPTVEQLAKLPDPPFAFGVSFPRNTTAEVRAAFRKRANLTALIIDLVDRGDMKLLPELREWTSVTELQLRSPCLKAEHVKQLAELKHLRALTIFHPLDDQAGIWNTAFALPNLERLTLGGVVQEAVTAFKGCPKLRALTLTQLRDMFDENVTWPKRAAAFTGLEELRLGSMRVSNAAVEQLKPLTKLKLLRIASDVHSDTIHRFDNSGIDSQLALYHKIGLLHAHPRFRATNGTRPASLADVTAVDLSHADVTAAGLKLVALCPNLQTLNLAEAYPAAGKLSALAGLTKLREVNLSRLPATDDDLKALKASKGLRTLTLEHLTDRSLRILREQGQLHALAVATAADGGRPATPADVVELSLATGALGVTPPGDASAAELTDYTNLKTLRVVELSSKGVEALARLPKLESLHFAPADEAALAALAKLPALRELSIGALSYPEAVKSWAALGRLDKVTTLALPHAATTPDHLKSLRGMAALHTLRLGDWSGLLHDQLKVLVEIGLGHAPVHVTGKDGRRPTKAEEVTGVVLRAINRRLPADGFKPLLAFPNLTDLDISECTGAVDPALKDLHGLKHLRRLSVTCLGAKSQSVEAATVRKLAEAVKLESLSVVNWMQVEDRKGELVREVAAIPGLRELRLQSVVIGDEGLAVLAAMPALRSLDVTADAGLTKQGLTVLAKCKTLRHLRLGVRFECDMAFKAWKELPGLETLEVGVAPVGGPVWRALAEYPALVRLAIAIPTDEYDGLPALARLTTLRALKLTGSDGHAGLSRSLSTLTQLTELDLTAARVPGDSGKLAENLRHDLPRCRLVGR